MDTNIVIIQLLQLLAGIGVFLMGCEVMSSNLESISSDKLKNMFAKVSDNKLIGVMIGALATVAIQSSGATTVMTIGFVNAGIISLQQAATIIFGAEIGTTITGQIVALGLSKGSAIDSNVIFSALAGIGVFMNMLAKKDKTKLLGYVLAGLGMLFVGLNMMSNAMEGFAQLDGLKDFLAGIDNVFLLVIAGAVLTAIIQSSSAITSISITMVVAGLISLQQGIYITLGANVGTCLTGILAGMKSTSTNAKRTSLIQLIFNISGVVLALVVDLLIQMISGGNWSFSKGLSTLFPGQPHTQLAMFHTIFNIISVILVIPVSDLLVKATIKLIPQDSDDYSQERFFYVDENMLTTPPIAVQQVKKEILNMADMAISNFNRSINMIKTLDFEELDKFRNIENQLNFLNKNLVDLIVKLSSKSNINKKDKTYLSTTYKTISDLERIGDYSENIVEYAQSLSNLEDGFSKEALVQLDEAVELINQLYKHSIDAYENSDRKEFTKAMKIEDKVDDLTEKMSEDHITRLNKGVCSAESGSLFMKVASDIERIGDHLININDKDYEISH